jgi:hypothetical protein
VEADALELDRVAAGDETDRRDDGVDARGVHVEEALAQAADAEIVGDVDVDGADADARRGDREDVGVVEDLHRDGRGLPEHDVGPGAEARPLDGDGLAAEDVAARRVDGVDLDRVEVEVAGVEDRLGAGLGGDDLDVDEAGLARGGQHHDAAAVEDEGVLAEALAEVHLHPGGEAGAEDLDLVEPGGEAAVRRDRGDGEAGLLDGGVGGAGAGVIAGGGVRAVLPGRADGPGVSGDDVGPRGAADGVRAPGEGRRDESRADERGDAKERGSRHLNLRMGGEADLSPDLESSARRPA